MLAIMTAALLAMTTVQDEPPADLVRIEPGTALPHAENIKAGQQHYLRFMMLPDGSNRLVALEKSTVLMGDTGEDDTMVITHDGNGPDMSYGFRSTVEARTLRPIAHHRWRDWNGDKADEKFDFANDGVTGNYLLKGEPATLDLDIPGGVYNFEIDLETLKALPWAADRTIVIPFYHPGGEPPADYRFVVEGEEEMEVGGVAMPVWRVTTDYNAPERGGATFWIAKEGGTVLRVEQPLPNGATFVKALVAG